MQGITRREALLRAGAAGIAIGAGWRPGIARADTAGAAGLHVHYGADPTREMAVSWRTPVGAGKPRLRLGTPDGGLIAEFVPETKRVVDSDPDIADPASYPVSEYQHVRLDKLAPGQTYVYELQHDGAPAVRSTFATAPAGRRPVRFTAFGDQGTGTTSDVASAPQGAWVVDHVEALAPAFHLHLGDLAYSNLQQAGSRGPAWDRFVDNNGRSAQNRPWMYALANHEIDGGTGPQGYGNYLGRFAHPENASRQYPGHWYAFTAGNVRVIVTDANDACFQDGGVDMYIHGYSGGMQVAWLEDELRAARASKDVDWVVCVVHQLIMSSTLAGNGSDLGVRKAFYPLFDRYGVDLVLSGHDHCYERTYAVRGVVPGSPTATPAVADRSLDVVDTTKGTVYMVLGGGGTSIPSNVFDVDAATGRRQARVIVEEKGSASATEDADWSAVRDEQWPWGFASFDVDPGNASGGKTAIDVTVRRTVGPVVGGQAAGAQVLESFRLERPRSDH